MLRFYQLLLHLYPRAFRDEYGKEMELAFRDRWRDEAGPWLAVTAIGDVIVNASRVHFEMLWQDVRYGLRTMRKELSFSLTAIATLALGIGSATAMYSLLHAVLIRPLPFAEPDRVVRILDTNSARNISGFASSTPNFQSWRERATTLESMAAFTGEDLTLSDNQNPERARGLMVLGPFWSVAGQRLLAGRVFDAGDHEPGKHRVVILGEEFWRRRFGGDYRVIGTTIPLNGQSWTVTGVAPSELAFRRGVDVFVPIALDQEQRNRGDRRLTVIGRLKAGVSPEAAEQELYQIAQGLEREFPRANEGWRVRVMGGREWLIEPAVRDSLGVLFGAVCLLLLVACVNVANLLIARATSRRREISVRLAMGANQGRLTRQLATENLLLAGLGGAFGVALAWAMLRGVRPLLPPRLPGVAELQVDANVLLFALCISAIAGMLFGIAPALIASRGEIRETLQSGGRGTSDATRHAAMRKALVVAQLAMATVLSIGALLMTTTFARIVGQNFGFRPEHLLTARITPPVDRFDKPEKALAYYEAIVAEVKSLPGVSDAGLSSEIPFGPVTTEMPAIASERAASIQKDGIQAQWRIVTGGYAQTLGVPLLRGRWWTPADNAAGRPVLASQDLVRRLWPEGGDPVGRRIRLGNGRDFTIIGVTGDLRYINMTERSPTATIYYPVTFFPWPTMSLVVRTTGDPTALTPALRAAIRRVDPSLPLFDVRTMETQLGQTASAPRLAAVIFALFAGLAVLLGAIGVAGLVFFSVAKRRNELAVRMALGASPARVAGEVVRSHFLLCTSGLAIGVAGAWALRPAIASLLFGVEAGDLSRFAIAIGVLGGVALLACLIPARRVASIDPASALRAE